MPKLTLWEEQKVLTGPQMLLIRGTYLILTPWIRLSQGPIHRFCEKIKYPKCCILFSFMLYCLSHPFIYWLDAYFHLLTTWVSSLGAASITAPDASGGSLDPCKALWAPVGLPAVNASYEIFSTSAWPWCRRELRPLSPSSHLFCKDRSIFSLFQIMQT